MRVDPATEVRSSCKHWNEIDAGLLGTFDANEHGSGGAGGSHRDVDIDDEKNWGCDAKLLDFKEMRSRVRILGSQILENK